MPETALGPCAAPQTYFPAGVPLDRAQHWEATGRLGDALIDCGARHAALAAWARGVSTDLSEAR